MKCKFTYVMMALAVTVVSCSTGSDRLIRNLDSDSRALRLKATIKLTTKTKDPETVQKLVALLDSENERTVLIVTQILGTADSSVVVPLSKMINHPNYIIRDRAVQSIGLIGYRESAPYLIAALKDSSATVRHTAVKMLGSIDNPEVVPHLYPMFRDEVDSVRAVTVQSLYMYHKNQTADIRAADFAVPMNDKSDLVRYVAAQALGESYADSIVAGNLLVEALSDQNKYVRLKSIISIGQIKYEPAIPRLKEMYDLATIDEEFEISEVIKVITGEEFPPIDADI